MKKKLLGEIFRHFCMRTNPKPKLSRSSSLFIPLDHMEDYLQIQNIVVQGIISVLK